MRPAPSILIVEDDENIRQMLEFMLQRQGFEVFAAPDGLAASRFIESHDPVGLALLDVMLPFVDGFELIAQIRAEPRWATTPVMMLTAKSQEQDVVRALDAGANDYIQKPFVPAELLARVRRHVKSSG